MGWNETIQDMNKQAEEKRRMEPSDKSTVVQCGGAFCTACVSGNCEHVKAYKAEKEVPKGLIPLDVLDALIAASRAISCAHHIYDKYANASWKAGISKDLEIVQAKIKDMLKEGRAAGLPEEAKLEELMLTAFADISHVRRIEDCHCEIRKGVVNRLLAKFKITKKAGM